MVELARHQMRFVLDDDGIDLAQCHAARGFQAKQTATDDDGAARAHRACEQSLDVIETAETEDAAQFAARNWRDMSAGAETQYQLGIAPAPAELIFDFPASRSIATIFGCCTE